MSVNTKCSLPEKLTGPELFFKIAVTLHSFPGTYQPTRLPERNKAFRVIDQEPDFRELILAVRTMKRGWRGMGVRGEN